jgi:hypothetical protein
VVVSEGAAVEGQLRLVALPLLAFISFVFFFGLGCAAVPTCLLYRVVRCYIIYSGAKACFELMAMKKHFYHSNHLILFRMVQKLDSESTSG